MICTNCKTAADLTEAAGSLFEPLQVGATGVTAETGPYALATAAAIVRLHTQCDGSDQGCGCQHRDTAAERRPVIQ